jgi:hypothetical protein
MRALPRDRIRALGAVDLAIALATFRKPGPSSIVVVANECFRRNSAGGWDRTAPAGRRSIPRERSSPSWRWPWRRSGRHDPAGRWRRLTNRIRPRASSSRRRVGADALQPLAITSRTSLTRGFSNSATGETPRSRKVEANQQSGGKHWPQSLLQRSARKRADNSVDLLPILDHDEQRDRLRAKPGREHGIRVDVNLHDLEVPHVSLGEIFKHGRDHPTGSAPRRPKIHHHGHGRGRLGPESAGVPVHDPRKIGLAPRASRHSLGDRGDPVARIAGRAADDRHDD